MEETNNLIQERDNQKSEPHNLEDDLESKEEENPYGWIAWIDRIAETTGRNWTEVYELTVGEFLMTRNYIIQKDKELKKKYKL